MPISLRTIASAVAASRRGEARDQRIAALRAQHGPRLTESEALAMMAREDAAAAEAKSLDETRRRLAQAITGNASDGGLL